jgi:hypothetical protein
MKRRPAAKNAGKTCPGRLFQILRPASGPGGGRDAPALWGRCGRCPCLARARAERAGWLTPAAVSRAFPDGRRTRETCARTGRWTRGARTLCQRAAALRALPVPARARVVQLVLARGSIQRNNGQDLAGGLSAGRTPCGLFSPGGAKLALGVTRQQQPMPAHVKHQMW